MPHMRMTVAITKLTETDVLTHPNCALIRHMIGLIPVLDGIACVAHGVLIICGDGVPTIPTLPPYCSIHFAFACASKALSSA